VEHRLVPRVGEIVLLKEDAPRGLWRKAIIQELVPSADGLIRKVVVKPASTLGPKDGRTGPTTRALQGIIPLELSECRFADTPHECEVAEVAPKL